MTGGAFCVIVLDRFRDTFECLYLVFTRFGGDLLSHTLRCSTIGAKALNGRVRNGSGCFALAMTTKPSKNQIRPELDCFPAQVLVSSFSKSSI